ncbi:phage terminase large subunit [Altererythrobacter ishigakiensis]|uniref:Putative phage terminase large subunit-like protein n=1 Tax=Altererythrobacter ishigakiensis TaxID=476157 RepID=A0A562ULY3_9SPHN|nr:phage terminase large subunit [Altererythrobacter ishigakiensis]TWJ06623.1 putative phage terminase large subunit-like protein [Altererythrobacter ishigakiensis]
MTDPAELVGLPREIFDSMIREDFATFLAQVMAELEPGTDYTENWHIEVMANALEDVRRGETLRLMINLAPRSLKTIITSIAFPAFILGHDPTRRIMCVTYSKEVAKAQAVSFQRVMRSGWFRRVFPECHFPVHNRQLEWQTTEGGFRLATSVEGSMLGRGADFIILDDPNKGQEIFSSVARNKVISTWDNVISTRLNHPRESAIICVMQRLHEQDLAGHLLEQEEYRQILIPSIATEDEEWDLGNGRVHLRASGEPTQADRMDHREYERQRRIMGDLTFSAQYQQQPVPDDGIVIRREWLRYYEEQPREFETTLVSWDTASTLGENSDWSVGTVWGCHRGQIYLRDVIRIKMESPELTHLIEDTHCSYGGDLTLIEDGDLGRAIAQSLRSSSMLCRPNIVRPRLAKIERMQARAVLFETGKVLFPREAPWLATYQQELLGFPNARHDDQVDSTSQALQWFQRRLRQEMAAERPAGTRPRGDRRPQGLSFETGSRR